MRWRDQRRLDRRAARRVDRQRHRLGAAHIESALEQRRHRSMERPRLPKRPLEAMTPDRRTTGTTGPRRKRSLNQFSMSRHCRGACLRRQAARRRAGWPRRRRYSGRPAGAASAAALRAAAAVADRRARTRTRAAGGRRLTVTSPQPRRPRWPTISSSRSLRWMSEHGACRFRRRRRHGEPAREVGAQFDGRQRLAGDPASGSATAAAR